MCAYGADALQVQANDIQHHKLLHLLQAAVLNQPLWDLVLSHRCHLHWRYIPPRLRYAQVGCISQ